MPRNIGTQINEVLKAQGWKHWEYGRVSSYSTKIGFQMQLWAYSKDVTMMNINRNEDATYHILEGINGMSTSVILQDNIAEEDLFEVFQTHYPIKEKVL